MLYAKVTPLPPREEVYGGEPIRCEVRTSPEDELVCVVEQSDEGITVSVVESAFPCSKIKTLEETASV